MSRSYTAHELIYDQRRGREVEVTQRDTGQHSETLQQRSSSPELDEWPIGQKVRATHIGTHWSAKGPWMSIRWWRSRSSSSYDQVLLECIDGRHTSLQRCSTDLSEYWALIKFFIRSISTITDQSIVSSPDSLSRRYSPTVEINLSTISLEAKRTIPSIDWSTTKNRGTNELWLFLRVASIDEVTRSIHRRDDSHHSTDSLCTIRRFEWEESLLRSLWIEEIFPSENKSSGDILCAHNKSYDRCLTMLRQLKEMPLTTKIQCSGQNDERRMVWHRRITIQHVLFILFVENG